MNIGKFSPGILFSHGEAPSENLLPNQRFGFETVPSRTVSTSDNHYKCGTYRRGVFSQRSTEFSARLPFSYFWQGTMCCKEGEKVL
jgi:hypothetical protein